MNNDLFGASGNAVFTYDARRVVARQWTSPEYNGARLQFQVDSFRLEIANVSSRDRGWWHCRVEFETSSFRVQSTEIAVVGTCFDIRSQFKFECPC